MACTPETLGTRFEVPIFILHGADDPHVLPEFAERYVDAIHAPTKEFVRLPGMGHAAMLTRPDQFLTELLARVRPLVNEPAPAGTPPTGGARRDA